MQPVSEAGWPESLRPLYETVTGTSTAEAAVASAGWRESFAAWVRGATLDERTLARAAAWSRLDSGERTPAELLFLLSSCIELLWPYVAPLPGLLPRLMWRQEAMLAGLLEAGDVETVARVRRETEATVTTVLTRILKRHPESLRAMVGDAPCSFDGRALRFHGAVEVDLRQVLGTGARSIALLEQLRALMPATVAEGRDRLADFIRTRASRLPWREASEVLAERLFALATSPEGRSGMSGFLACYPAGRKEPDWCARAGLLLSRTLEVGGPPEVVENLCELLARFDAPPVDGLRGALGALVGGEFEGAADLGPVRFVLDHCQATLRKGEPGLVLTLLWLEERLFRAAVRKGVPDAFERRKRALTKLRPGAPGFEHLHWLAEECAELWPRFLPGGVRPGLDELAAWRHEVAERVGRKPVLRKAAIEFFLWCAPDAASSEAELTVLALVRTATDRRQVRRLKEHPSSRVRLRVRTLQSWFQGEEGKSKSGTGVEPVPGTGPATLTEALRHLHVTRAVPLGGRTWLRDRDLEEALLGAIGRAEAEFSSRYPARFREDTPALAAELLEGLSAELARVQEDLSALMAQGQSAPRALALSLRRRESVEPVAAAETTSVVTVAITSATEATPVGAVAAAETTSVEPMPIASAADATSVEAEADAAASEATSVEAEAVAAASEAAPVKAEAVAAASEAASVKADAVAAASEAASVKADAVAVAADATSVGTESVATAADATSVGAESVVAAADATSVGAESVAAASEATPVEAGAVAAASEATSVEPVAAAANTESASAERIAPESEPSIAEEETATASVRAVAQAAGFVAAAAEPVAPKPRAPVPEPLPGAGRSGVEVAFVLDIAVGEFLRTRRMVSLHVVKLEQRGEGQWLPAFKLGREHLDAQLLRTEAAFCLFLVPPFPRAECWVVPSRTVRALMESQRSLSGVSREAVQRVARPLSHWLLQDVVGLWTGDERPEALARLDSAGDGPDFTVEWRLG
ncbi:hypothetical protein [Myxococcus sp. Y35]|uniref:hypothetical protein n=1 Tax=Pseudomyxococcus flavus TaxID=3115648 RepID=UPI003CF8739D